MIKCGSGHVKSAAPIRIIVLKVLYKLFFSKLSNKRNLDEIEREKKRQNAVINRQIKKDKNKLRKQVKISIC